MCPSRKKTKLFLSEKDSFDVKRRLPEAETEQRSRPLSALATSRSCILRATNRRSWPSDTVLSNLLRDCRVVVVVSTKELSRWKKVESFSNNCSGEMNFFLILQKESRVGAERRRLLSEKLQRKGIIKWINGILEREKAKWPSGEGGEEKC
jgi:hypothetical protein